MTGRELVRGLMALLALLGLVLVILASVDDTEEPAELPLSWSVDDAAYDAWEARELERVRTTRRAPRAEP